MRAVPKHFFHMLPCVIEQSAWSQRRPYIAASRPTTYLRLGLQSPCEERLRPEGGF